MSNSNKVTEQQLKCLGSHIGFYTALTPMQPLLAN